MSLHDSASAENTTDETLKPNVYQPTKESKSWVRTVVRLTPWLIFLMIFASLSLLLVHWDGLMSQRRVQKTNNAYVHFDNIVIEAKVSGYVKEVGFSDFQSLKSGDVLISLVDDDYRMAVKQAEAKRNYAQAALQKLELEEELQKAYIRQAQASLESAQARWERSEREHGRISTLFQQRVVSDSEADSAETDLKTAQADLMESKAMLSVSEQKLKLLSGDRELRQAELEATEAALEQARIDLSHTKIAVPVRSMTGTCKIREGELVKIGTVITTLTPDEIPYIIANYKETQLTNIHVGQQVSMKIDTFPGQVFKGRVSGISPATGATYSLLPVDNSAGNFTKVVQRIPVRIELESNQLLLDHLRAGMSVTTLVDTQTSTIHDGMQSEPRSMARR